MTMNERKVKSFAEKFGFTFYGTEEMKRDMARRMAKEVVAFGAYVGNDAACELEKTAGHTEEDFFNEFMLKLDDNELDVLATYLWDGHDRCNYDAVVYMQAGNISGLPDSEITLYFFKKEPEEVKSYISLVKMADEKIYEVA